MGITSRRSPRGAGGSRRSTSSPARHSYNAQGRSVYKARPSPTELQGGLEEGKVTENRTLAPQTLLLNANRNNPPYNNNQFPGYDPDNQYIGLSTPLDKITNEGEGISPNPMDTNQLIKQGYYKDNEVKIWVDKIYLVLINMFHCIF